MGASLKILLCFLGMTIQASEISLMLSPAEEAALAQAQDQARTHKEAKNSDTLRLNGIIYTDPTSWTIWINGRPIKAGETVETLRILKVTPDFVDMIWSPAPNQHHQICLKPNEEFQNINSHP